MIRTVVDFFLRRYVRLPEHPTKYRVVRWLGRNVFPEDGVVGACYPGIDLLLHPRDWIKYVILRGEHYEPLTLHFIAQNLSEGDIAVLAGVNFGLHTAVAARAVGDGGKVVGVEPQPASLLRARKNLQLNGLAERVELVAAALGPVAGFAPMGWSDHLGNSGRANLFDPAAGLTVCVVLLSSLLTSLKPRSARLLLLDVEGYEPNVLAGCDPSNLPELIVVEVDATLLARGNRTPADLFSLLKGLGYRLHNLRGQEVRHGDTAWPENNVVAAQPGATITWA